jgi:hypothetical protein
MPSNQDVSDDPPRYFLSTIGLDLDLDAQLLAIRTLLERNRAADADLTEEIRHLNDRAGATGRESLIDHWLVEIHRSIYQDAAHSLAAVGMLAPLIESILVQSFSGFGKKYGKALIVAAPRRATPEEKVWDCRWYVNEHGTWAKSIVRGTLQLSTSIGLALPDSAATTLSALFAYRNENFHNGLEWPIENRTAFASDVKAKGWGDWFRQAESDGKPWIIYMSPAFVDHCLAFTEELLDALGTFAFETASKRTEEEIPDYIRKALRGD